MVVLVLAINYKGWIADTIYYEQQAVRSFIESKGGQCIFYGPGFKYETNDALSIVQSLKNTNTKPDIIVSFMNAWDLIRDMPDEVIKYYDIPRGLHRFPVNLGKVTDIPKVLWMNDFWALTPEQWQYAIIPNGFETILSVYAPFHIRMDDFRKSFPRTIRENVTFKHLPRALRADFFLTRSDEERDIDVTMLGAMNPNMYPTRNFFANTLKNQDGLKFFYRDHPGYNFQEKLKKDITGIEYRNILARSKIFVTCGLKYNLPIIKLYEILASGAVLVCDHINRADLLGLVPGVHYVETSRQDFMATIKELLVNREKRESIAQQGHKLFLEKHQTHQRATTFYKYLEETITQYSELKTQALVKLSYPKNVKKTILKTIFTKLPNSLKIVVYCLLQRNHVVNKNISIFLEPALGSSLDWRNVVGFIHILDFDLILSSEDVRLFHKFGLNSFPGGKLQPAIVTEYAELVIYRPFLLRQLAIRSNATTCVEVGTARGLQTLIWAQSLEERKLKKGKVYTCDILDHETPNFYVPGNGEKYYSRHELFQSIKETTKHHIYFIHGNSKVLAKELESEMMKIDIAYIDGQHDYDGVMTDFHALQPFLHKNSILIFDDVDARFNGVEEAVSEILRLSGDKKAIVISFSPSFYKVVVVAAPNRLDEIFKGYLIKHFRQL